MEAPAPATSPGTIQLSETVASEVKHSDSSSDGDLKADLKKNELEERSSSFRVSIYDDGYKQINI